MQADRTSGPGALTREEPTAVTVDGHKCEGHGRCYAVAPDLFAPIDDHGHAGFASGSLTPADKDQQAAAQRAIDACPEQALAWG